MLAPLANAALRSAFPEVPFVSADPPDPVATLDGPCAELSPMQVCDDGDEITVHLGTTTHAHLACHDDALSDAERERQTVEDMVAFVRDLFADRIVATTGLGGRIGGWRRIAADEAVPRNGRVWRRYVWSRPLQ